MKQPYNYWLKVPEGVGWDRKESPEPNLHVCGEDDTKRAVYWKNALRKGIGTSKQIVLRRKPYKRRT